MPMETTHDLFLYELGIMRDTEDGGRRLYDLLALRAEADDLVQLFETLKSENEQLLDNINSCGQAFGYMSTKTPSETARGVIQRFEEFVRMRPAQAMLDQFAVDTAILYSHICIAGYTTLLDWAILLNESACVHCLHANLTRKQENASRLEQFSHELGVRILTPA